jgi:hypothetical protein
MGHNYMRPDQYCDYGPSKSGGLPFPGLQCNAVIAFQDAYLAMSQQVPVFLLYSTACVSLEMTVLDHGTADSLRKLTWIIDDSDLLIL